MSRDECQSVLQTSIDPNSRTAFVYYITRKPYIILYADRDSLSRKINGCVLCTRRFVKIQPKSTYWFANHRWQRVSIGFPIETGSTSLEALLAAEFRVKLKTRWRNGLFFDLDCYDQHIKLYTASWLYNRQTLFVNLDLSMFGALFDTRFDPY